MNREKTNSITHLVKIVAKEAIEDSFMHHRLNELDDTVENILDRIDRLEQGAHFHPSSSAFPYHSGNKLNRSGESWSKQEEKELDDELTRALQWMATKHGRTIGAIQARITLRGLI